MKIGCCAYIRIIQFTLILDYQIKTAEKEALSKWKLRQLRKAKVANLRKELETDIPNTKTVYLALSTIYGIAGKFRGLQFLRISRIFVNLENFIPKNFWLLDKFIIYGSPHNISIYLRESNVAGRLYQ